MTGRLSEDDDEGGVAAEGSRGEIFDQKNATGTWARWDRKWVCTGLIMYRVQCRQRARYYQRQEVLGNDQKLDETPVQGSGEYDGDRIEIGNV